MLINNMHWCVLHVVFVNIETANVIFELQLLVFGGLKTTVVILFMQNVNRNFLHVVYPLNQ
jgi:hypothetical protein